MGTNEIIDSVFIFIITLMFMYVVYLTHRIVNAKPIVRRSQMTGYYEDYKEFDDHYATLYGTHEIDQMIVHRDILIVTYKRIL